MKNYNRLRVQKRRHRNNQLKVRRMQTAQAQNDHNHVWIEHSNGSGNYLICQICGKIHKAE